MNGIEFEVIRPEKIFSDETVLIGSIIAGLLIIIFMAIEFIKLKKQTTKTGIFVSIINYTVAIVALLVLGVLQISASDYVQQTRETKVFQEEVAAELIPALEEHYGVEITPQGGGYWALLSTNFLENPGNDNFTSARFDVETDNKILSVFVETDGKGSVVMKQIGPGSEILDLEPVK